MSKDKILRNYQEEIMEEIAALVEAGEKSFFIKSAMGTGKTVCLNEVCKRFSNGKNLFIGPKESIKAVERDFTVEYEFITYDKLYSIYKSATNDSFNKYLTDYSIIIMDEAHKTGAKLLSKPLLEIKNNGTYDLFVGASAHSRRTDQIHTEEDQADVLFDGNIVGNFDLNYCFANNILTMPKYYYCEAKLNAQIEDEIYKLQMSKIPQYIKKNLIEKLQTVKLAYENYSSLEKTLNRGLKDYKDRNNLKIVIFISRIDKYQETFKIFDPIFQSIFEGRNINYYSFFSGSKDKVLVNFLEESGINILFAVDKINLSLHHEDLNVCIMYRKTTSAIVYEQQCGRVLFKDKPGCIIDIVDNGHTVNSLDYSGAKSVSEYAISKNRNSSNNFNDLVCDEFQTNFIRFKEIIDLIKSKNYKNLSVDYKGENNTVKYFTNKYRVVTSDVFYFMSKDIPFDRALEAARTEYYVTIENKEYSASSLAQRFNLNADELRFKIKNNTFKLNEDMIEFFNIDPDEETFENISIKIKELEDLLKKRENS